MNYHYNAYLTPFDESYSLWLELNIIDLWHAWNFDTYALHSGRSRRHSHNISGRQSWNGYGTGMSFIGTATPHLWLQFTRWVYLRGFDLRLRKMKRTFACLRYDAEATRRFTSKLSYAAMLYYATGTPHAIQNITCLSLLIIFSRMALAITMLISRIYRLNWGFIVLSITMPLSRNLFIIMMLSSRARLAFHVIGLAPCTTASTTSWGFGFRAPRHLADIIIIFITRAW